MSSTQHTCRLVSVTSDDILTLHESNAITWRREEALASVSATLFLDLPAPSPELAAQWRAAAPTLSERVQAEFLSLKASTAAPALRACQLRLPCSDGSAPATLPRGPERVSLLESPADRTLSNGHCPHLICLLTEQGCWQLQP